MLQLKNTTFEIFEINGKFYPVEYSEEKYQVYSIGKDNPPDRDNTRYCAKATDEGIKYVASPSDTKAAARARIYRWKKKIEG